MLGIRSRPCALFLLALSCTVPLALAQELSPKKTFPAFSVGVTGITVTIESGLLVTVQAILPHSPAATADLKKGDVILRADGESLGVRDPRVPLGEALRAAEAKDGRLQLRVRRGEETGEATVVIPRLGAYSVTWPENCTKSAAIIKSTAAYVASVQQRDGSYAFGSGRPERDGLMGSLAGLFLLSTDDPTYLPAVERHIRSLVASIEKRTTTNNWHLGYQGILLAEYYLKSGDESVLGALEALCDQAIRVQAAGGWGHWGVPGPGYVQSGLMSSAGVPVLTTLILARECGVAVDEVGYTRALKFMYRMVGHGCVPYGDHRSELWWSNTNGRNGMLACAFSLIDQPEFQEAAEHLALLVTDSYHQPEFGHTGGGFNFIWRGMSSVHVPRDRRSHYARQMQKLAWYYDLSRQPGGGFSMLATPPDNKRYTGLAWGTGALGLTYTAALATLRITGAARTKFSAEQKPVHFTWGTAADRVFGATSDADGFGTEAAEPHDVYDRLIGRQKGSASVAFCEQHLRHFSPLVRTWAARVLREKNSEDAVDALARAARHSDPRVRRAAFDALSGYDNWRRPMRSEISPAIVSKRFLAAILNTLRDPKSAWWEVDGALFALARAEPDDIRENMAVIDRFATHEEWYLREGSFWALVGLHATMTPSEFQKLTDMYARSRHVFQRASYDTGFRVILKNDKVALDRMTRRRAAKTLGRTTHDVPIAFGYGDSGIHEAAHRTMMILEHFDAKIFGDMIEDFATYLRAWEPYYQHSVWLITGSKWQPGILHVLEGLGAEGKPIVAELTNILARYDGFDRKRIGNPGKDLEQRIQASILAWKAKHSKRP